MSDITDIKVCSIIPARGGSKGVPGKNIKPLGGHPLIAYSIIASKLSKKIQRVIISTDSQEIADIARRYGAEAPFLRPSEFASDGSPDIDFVLHAIGWFETNEGKVPEYLVHLRPTTPMRDPLVIDDAISKLVADPEATSLRSAHEAPESPYKWFIRNERGYFTGVIPGYSNDRLNESRQSFPKVYVPDGYVDVLRTSFVKSAKKLHGDRMIGFVSAFCTEVDTKEDFERLEYELTKKENPLFDYLKRNF